jgi:hypothetical protein
MIFERELHFSKAEFKNSKYFPMFLILRKSVSSSGSM